MQGKSTRIGAYKCYQCRKPFTVKVGTIFENSHVKMNIWLLVDPDTGRIRSYTFDQMISTYVEPIVKANIAKETRLTTDQARLYKILGKGFSSHEAVNHSIG